MQTLGTCCTGIGLAVIVAAYYMPVAGIDDLLVLVGLILVPFGLVAAVIGRKPNQPV